VNIHNYEKVWLAGAMVLIVFFILTITYGAAGAGVAMIDDSEETVDPDALNDHERFSDPGVERVGEDAYEVTVVAYQFFFQPSTIEVPADSTVTFYITSADVIHSFSVVGTNANTMVIPGEVATLTVELEEPREYGIICTEYCGPGHHDMEALLDVQPESEFEGGDGQ
jgi:cytochrome c oxidase subunit 2